MTSYLVVGHSAVSVLGVCSSFAGSYRGRPGIGEVSVFQSVPLTEDRQAENDLGRSPRADLFDPFVRVARYEVQRGWMKGEFLLALIGDVSPASQEYQIDDGR